ncbi:Hypothetical protein, putative [Bodo saltans]|uniref:Uncharacterized protein n=1 Tax=Bodo saltans TaxID=75058 RepID=A0A0S4IYH0_BODSA|nr:Hypothetical protein, putative [Bodo saltans]|eukprot:CUG19851.1 Hypothetical protein, putative [Bodo saltans]
MVYVIKLITDVNLAIRDNSRVLYDIKRRYPQITQLFHARKSHHVHLVGSPDAFDDMSRAAEEVLAVCGEPFHLSPTDAAVLAQLVFAVNIMTLEKLLQPIFLSCERLAADDQVRQSWSTSGPLYGICASSQGRRRQLMEASLCIINEAYQLSLTLLSLNAYNSLIPIAPATLTVESPAPSSSSPGATTLQNLSIFSTVSTAAPSSRAVTPRLDDEVQVSHEDKEEEEEEDVHRELTSSSGASSDAAWDAINDAVRPMKNWGVLTNHNDALTEHKFAPDRDAPSCLHNVVADVVGSETEPPVVHSLVELCLIVDASTVHSKSNELVPETPARKDCREQELLVPATDGGHAIRSICDVLGVSVTITPSQVQEGNNCLHIKLFPRQTQSLDHHLTTEDDHDQKSTPAAGVVTSPAAIMRMHIAADTITAHMGVGPMFVNILRPTPLQCRVLLASHKHKRSPQSPVPKGQSGSSGATAVQSILNVALDGYLLRGEHVDVFSVQSFPDRGNEQLYEAATTSPIPNSSACEIRISFDVRGLKGKGLAHRAACVKSLVDECLNNVCAIGNDDYDFRDDHNHNALPLPKNTADRVITGTLGSDGALAMLSELHGVYVASRTVLFDDTVSYAVVVGLPSSIAALVNDLASVGTPASSAVALSPS